MEIQTQLMLPAPLIKCDNCGEYVDDKDTQKDANNNDVCNECKENDYTTCSECDDLYNNDVISHDSNGNAYCESCVDSCTFWCEKCEELHHENINHFNINGHTYCEQCADELFSICADCGEYFSFDDAGYTCEYCDNSYCGDCNCDCSEHGSLDERRATSEKQTGTTPGNYITDPRYFGVEIEAENGDSDDIADNVPGTCGLSRDGSLDSSGVEVQTPPASLDVGEKIILDTCKGLNDNGFEGTRACGLHVHLDASDIHDDPVKLAHVLRTMYAVEDVLFSMLPRSRWSNTYCMRISEKYSFDDFSEPITMNDFESKWYKTTDKGEIEHNKTEKYHSTRYCSLNLHSYLYRRTIEFRHHAGTTDPVKILQWVKILQAIINYAVNRYDDKAIIALYHTPTTAGKLKKIVSIFKLTKDTKTYITDRIKKFNPDFTFTGNESGEQE